MNKLFKKKLRLRFLVPAAIVIVLLAVGGVLAYTQLRPTANKPTSKDSINYAPATEAEKQDSDRLKEVDTQRKDNPSTSSVSPVIVDASQYGNQVEVRSYVPGIIEDGGTCTITFTKDQLKLTKQTAASKDATTTRCGNLTVNRSEFQQSGQWMVTVSYSSQKYSGDSGPATLEVD